jgi:phosphoadenosine phosphosulfate reductase
VNTEYLKLCVPRAGQAWNESQVEAVSPCLETKSANERIQWALDFLPDMAVMTSSFGAQSAVLLHMLTELKPNIPVVLIDTGYLFDETYQFIDQLSRRLSLNLEVYRPLISPNWQETRFGRMWEKGVEGIQQYNQINKVEPMERALAELQVGTWFSGLRRVQSDSRKSTPVLQRHGRAVKVHPLADWGNRDMHRYLKSNDLPYHPLWDQGYVSIGDWHTSQPLEAGMTEQETRFFGLVRECGLNEPERFRQANAYGSP